MLMRLLSIDNPAVSMILRIVGLLLFTGVGLWFSYGLLAAGAFSGTSIFLSAIIALIVIGGNVIFLRSELYPLRWFVPGLALMAIMVLYPVAFTSYIAFTNYGTGNLLTEAQVIEQFESRTYLPEEGGAFSWTAYQSDTNEDEFLLWLQDGEESFLVGRNEQISLEEVNAAPLNDEGIPESIPGYTRLARGQTLRLLSTLSEIPFGPEGQEVFVRSMDSAAATQQKFVFDESRRVLIDQETGEEYEPVNGRFTNDEGEQLTPGFYVTIGLRNFTRLLDPNNPAFRGPFLQIFLWTFAFAFAVVLSTFGLGLLLAVVFNDPTLPGRKIIQSALVIPYAMPAFISVQVWRGLLNPQFGVLGRFSRDVFGGSPDWFTDPSTAKVGVLLVTLWLGFPYMFLICTGALQSIPSNIYEAARIDGADGWQQFVNITFPLLMVAVGPLLIGSFAFNFNNFTVIDVYNEGGPPIPNSPTPAGHTDILITYVFRLAFGGGRGVDYGYASAITIVIFALLATIVAFQFRYTRVLEEISENV